jgi:hypothetical protein
MLKPIFAVMATMLVSCGIAVTIQTVRASTGEDVVIRCRRCQLPQVAAPSPVVSCKQCGLVQRPVLVPCVNSTE